MENPFEIHSAPEELSPLRQAERALVAATLVDPKVFSEAALRYEQFSDMRCSLAWKSLGKLLERGLDLDPITLSEDLAGRIPYTELSSWVVELGVPNVLAWSTLVREAHIERGLKSIGFELDKFEVPEQLTKVRERLDSLESSSSTDLPTLAELATSECKRIQELNGTELTGLPTGLGIGRVVPGGIPRGKVTMLFGESGNFKTTVKNNIVLGIASAGHGVLDVSLEDTDDLTAHRFIANCTGISYGRIAAQELSANERAQLTLPERAIEAARNVILAGEIWPNIDEIIRTARYYKHKRGLSAVVIDYVQLLESRNGRQTEKEKLDEIMRKSQLAAKRDNIAYIIVSQVKQDVDQRTNHAPRITDMIGSSAMRTAAKLALGVYRPGLYYSVPPKGSGYEKLFSNHPMGPQVYKNILELHFLKNVLGQPKVVIHCLVTPETGLIEPFDMRPYA